MNKKIIFLGFVLFLGCISGKTKPATDNVAPSSTVVKTSIPQLETTTTTLPPQVRTIKKVIYVYENVTINISKLQEHQLNNLQPKLCKTACCSAGFDECKRQIRDILPFLEGPKFSERKSTGLGGYYDIADNDPGYLRLPKHEDNFTVSVKLNNSMWQVDANGTDIKLYSTYALIDGRKWYVSYEGLENGSFIVIRTTER